MLDLDQAHTSLKDGTAKTMRNFATKDSLHNRIDELRKTVHNEVNGISEKVTMQNDKVDGFMVKLNNAEEFNKTFKQIMESLKN